MNLKTKIKNDLWRYNYIIPFVKRYRLDAGPVTQARHVATAYAGIRPVRGTQKERSVGDDTRVLLEAVEIRMPEKNQFIYFIDEGKTIAVPGNVLSNFTLAYDKAIHGTFASLAGGAAGSDAYGVQAGYVAEGVRALAGRVAAAIGDSALPAAIRERRLRDFSRMLDSPADHFDEALQRILFFNQVLWQTRHRLNGLGRLDRILADLYDADLSTGYLTREDASGMVHDFLGQLSQYADYKSDALKGDIGQIIILGGKNPDGSYFHHDLTEIFLIEQARLRKPDPKTLLRVSENTPKELVALAVDCLTARTGSPLLSNDDAVIPALLDFGIPEEDACQYCTSACWEPLIVGKSLAQNNVAVFDFFQALDEVLDRTSDAAGYGELVEDYIKRNKARFGDFLCELDAFRWAKDPLVSLFMDGCSEKRLDVSEGGAEYNNYGVTTVALSNVVDSLLNVKDLVFERKQCKLSELNRQRKNNFAGNGRLYATLQKGRHFGRDEIEAVSLARQITDSLREAAKGYRNPLGGTVKFGLSSPGYNMVNRHAAADLAGRKAGMPYNTHISCMNAGYTEVVGFAAKLDYKSQRFNGNVVDFFMPSHFIDDNKEKFVLFLRGATKAGFFQMQMNLMDSATLIDAKAHPEKYAGLIVRVWGFSAYFNDLPESYKDLMIARAKAAERAT